MNPKRRFFQIHLSTAVVLMLVAGVLVWANVRGTKSRFEVRELVSPEKTSEVVITTFGWPARGIVRFHNLKELHGEQVEHVVAKIRQRSSESSVLNGLVTIIILLAVYFFCEWLIRRRAARKANE